MTATIAGVNTWAVAISDDVTANAPSGNIIYLLAKRVGGSASFTQSIKALYGRRSRSDRTGKREVKVNISEAQVINKVEANVAAEFNAITLKFFTWHKELANPIYCFIKHISSGVYLAPTATSADANQGYLKGYIKDFNWEFDKGNNVVFKSINFQECLNA